MYYATKNGVEKRVESWKIIIPLSDNQQKGFPEKIIEVTKSNIINEFGGLTSCNVVGYWKSGRDIFFDKSIMIIVDISVKNHKTASTFFVNLKKKLRQKLRQEKVYVTCESQKSELLSDNEFLRELGFEIPVDQPQQLTQENINKLVGKLGIVEKRLGYKTLSLKRNKKSKKIIWEREILGIKILTEIEDSYPKDVVILPADNLEMYFTEDSFGKPLIIIGDYEYQSYILDKEKRRYIVGESGIFSKYDKGNKEPLYGPHPWHGMLRTSQFIPTFADQILINYIILRELGIEKHKIKINVGSDGSRQRGGGKLLRCPAIIPDQKVQKVIIKSLKKAIDSYESGVIDEIALMQAKVMNRYNEKRALIQGSQKPDFSNRNYQ